MPKTTSFRLPVASAFTRNTDLCAPHRLWRASLHAAMPQAAACATRRRARCRATCHAVPPRMSCVRSAPFTRRSSAQLSYPRGTTPRDVEDAVRPRVHLRQHRPRLGRLGQRARSGQPSLVTLGTGLVPAWYQVVRLCARMGCRIRVRSSASLTSSGMKMIKISPSVRARRANGISWNAKPVKATYALLLVSHNASSVRTAYPFP